MLARERDLAVAGAAFGEFTAAAIFPSAIARPVGPRLVFPLARYRAVLFAIGLDDQGPSDRMLKLVIVYREAAQARADAKLIGHGLAATPLPSAPSQRFGDVLEALDVEVRQERAVLVTGRLRRGETPSFWRRLVEAGDLAAVLRRA